MGVRQWLDGVEPGLDAAHIPPSAGRTVEIKRSAASRANSSIATRTADRLMTLIWSSALSLFWKALRHTPSALTQPANSGCQVSTSAAALRTASDGRHGQRVRADWSAANHSRSRTARRKRNATEKPGQPRKHTGGHAPGLAGRAKPSRTPRRPPNRSHQRKHYKARGFAALSAPSLAINKSTLLNELFERNCFVPWFVPHSAFAQSLQANRIFQAAVCPSQISNSV